MVSVAKAKGRKATINKIFDTAGSHCGPDTVGVAFYSIHK